MYKQKTIEVAPSPLQSVHCLCGKGCGLTLEEAILLVEYFPGLTLDLTGVQAKVQTAAKGFHHDHKGHSELVFCPYTDEHFSLCLPSVKVCQGNKSNRRQHLSGSQFNLRANKRDPIKSLEVERIKPT